MVNLSKFIKMEQSTPKSTAMESLSNITKKLLLLRKLRGEL